MAMLDRHAVTPAAMLSSTPISMPQLGTIVLAPLAPSERLSLPFRTLLACRWTLWHVSTAGEAPFETNFFFPFSFLSACGSLGQKRLADARGNEPNKALP